MNSVSQKYQFPLGTFSDFEPPKICVSLLSGKRLSLISLKSKYLYRKSQWHNTFTPLIHVTPFAPWSTALLKGLACGGDCHAWIEIEPPSPMPCQTCVIQLNVLVKKSTWTPLKNTLVEDVFCPYP